MPTIEELEKVIACKYQLAIVAALRAKQINSGSPALIETEETNPVLLAIEEIAKGKVPFEAAKNNNKKRN